MSGVAFHLLQRNLEPVISMLEKKLFLLTSIHFFVACSRKKIVDVTSKWYLVPKSFSPSVRKIVLVFEKNLRVKAENWQNFLNH